MLPRGPGVERNPPKLGPSLRDRMDIDRGINPGLSGCAGSSTLGFRETRALGALTGLKYSCGERRHPTFCFLDFSIGVRFALYFILHEGLFCICYKRS